MKKRFFSSFIFIATLCAGLKNDQKDLKFFHLDRQNIENYTQEVFSELIKGFDFLLISNFRSESSDLEDKILSDLLGHYTYQYTSEEFGDKWLLSTHELSHYNISYINSENYFIELGHESFDKLYVLGYLPSLSFENIETLKSYYTATNPYVRSLFCGDFKITQPIPLWDLCTKGEITVKAEADNKGNKAASGEVKIKSNDQTKSASGSVEVKENKKGEKEARVKVEAKYEF